MIPDQSVAAHVFFRHIEDKGAVNPDRYQVDYVTQEPETIAPGAQSSLESHLFVARRWFGCWIDTKRS